MERAGVSVFVEVRSINNRYLKVSLKSNETLGGAMEIQIEEEVRKYISRGTVNVGVRIATQKNAVFCSLNLPQLSEYRKQFEGWLASENLSQSWDPGRLLTLSGVVQEKDTTEDTTEKWSHIREVLVEALKKFVAMRQVEGKAMADDLLANLADVETLLQGVIARAPEVSRLFADRLVERLNRLLEQQNVEGITRNDVMREMGIFADKCDISEEISRLKSHIAQFRTILAQETTPGKRLDFLTQELFRETNTIGSKANDVIISQTVIQMKSSIERIREQVQNIE